MKGNGKKKLVYFILLLPFLLITLVILFEIFGMIVNHAATASQTRQLSKTIRSECTEVEIIDTYSETGNTSGTGNHVDMESVVLFSTTDSKKEVEEKLYQKYENDMWSCWVEELPQLVGEENEMWRYDFLEELELPEEKEGCFVMFFVDEAPFRDNIEGH